MTPALLLPQEAAEILGVSGRTLARRVAAEELRALHLAAGDVRLLAADLVPGAPGALAAVPRGPLGVRQVAALLRLSPGTVRAWCRREELPGRLRQGQWVVRGQVLRRWMAQRIRPADLEERLLDECWPGCGALAARRAS